jgi:4-methylaminobutanoate oxidase (formaldehyde-forming)
MVTEPIAGVSLDMPTLRDPDRLTYYKEEVGGLVMGGYEPNPIMWAKKGFPKGFHYQLLESNFDHFEPIMEQALGRVPALQTAGVKMLTNGPESFTPDGNCILGEAPELKNFYVRAGFNAYGIAAGGGAGMALAEWVANAGPPYDLWAVDIRRFGRPHFDTDWVRARTYKAYGKHYTMAWPAEEHDSGCPCRKSPLYERLKVDGAVFGEKLGWERPNLYADPDAAEQQRDIYTFERPNWHAAVGREHRAAREAAVLFDQTSLGKFVLKGPDAEAALNWIAANDMSKPVGSLVYTQMLNDQGGIECDLTCVRMAENEYYSVTGTGFVTHDFDHISKNMPAGMNAQLVDVTSAYAVLSLFGPNARPILQAITSDDISNDVLPFGASKTIDIAGCPVSALRVSYVGELGWELHLPTEYAAAVYDAIDHAGAIHALRNAGFCAIETLRLEKGFRAWSADIGPDHTSFEAGLGFAVKLDTNLAFKGRDALMAQASDGVKKRMTIFTTAPDVILLGREAIYRNGVRVGGLVRPGLAIPSANRLAWALCAAIR